MKSERDAVIPAGQPDPSSFFIFALRLFFPFLPRLPTFVVLVGWGTLQFFGGIDSLA